MTEEQFLSVARLREVEEKLEQLSRAFQKKRKSHPGKIVLDHFEFMELFRISRRTSQLWRAQARIPFSRIGGRLYFRVSDIRKLLKAEQVFPGKKTLTPKLK